MANDTAQPGKPTVIYSPLRLNWKNVVAGTVIALLIVAIGVFAFSYYNPNATPVPPIVIKSGTQSAKTSKATPSAEKDETAYWKVYENTNYNYSLKYPNELGIFNNDPQEMVTLAITPHLLLTNDPSMNKNVRVLTSDIPKSYSLLEIIVFYNKSRTEFKNYSLSDIANKDYEANKEDSKSVTPLKEVTFAGESAYTYQTVGSTVFNYIGSGWQLKDESLKIIEVEHKDNIYYLIYRPNKKVEQVVSTFKFLD